MVWEENRGWGGVADKVPEPPSELFRDHVYGCFFDDAHGLTSLDAIGVGQRDLRDRLPALRLARGRTRAKIAEEQMKGLDDDVIEKIVRGNAIRMLRLDL